MYEDKAVKVSCDNYDDQPSPQVMSQVSLWTIPI